MPEIVGRLRTPRLASAPGSPQVGEMYYDTGTNVLYWWNGTAWTSSAGGVSGSTKYSYTYTTLTGTPSSTEVRLDAAIGSATKLRAHQTSLGTLTMYDLESHAKPGSILLMASSNRIYSVFRVTTSAILAGYLELGVTYLGSGDVNDATAGTVSLEVIPGYAIPTGGATGQVLAKSSATNYATQWQAPLDLRYNGAWAAGTYTDGDIAIYNGVSYMAVRTTTQTPAPWVPSPSQTTYGTTLPASPVDGQEAILVDSTTSPTYYWRFRYNAGSTSAYKWEFVGGAVKTVYAGAGTWTDLSAVGGGAWSILNPRPLAFVAPRSGDYTVQHGGQCGGGSSGDYAQLSVGATGGIQGNAIAASVQVTGLMWNMTVAGQVNVLATDSIQAWYYGTAASIMFANRWMQITPMRVS